VSAADPPTSAAVPWADVLAQVPHAADWWHPGPGSWLYGPGVAGQEIAPGHGFGHGLLTLLVALVGVLTWRRRGPRALVLALAAGLVLLSTQVGGHTAWRALHALLPARHGVLLVGAITALLAPFLALGVALYVDRRRPVAWWGWALFVTLLVIAEQVWSGVA
jgi:hypothetical protein